MSDPETAKDIGNSFLKLGNKDAATQWYEKFLGVNNNYAPAFNNLANIKGRAETTRRLLIYSREPFRQIHKRFRHTWAQQQAY